MLERHRGDWDCAAEWIPVWISFGGTWQSGGDPLPWVAHQTLWQALGTHADHVRFHRRLGGVRRLSLPEDVPG